MMETHTYTRGLLSRAIEQGKVSHSYLFAGPEGTGKRTLAIELASALLCETKTYPPCLQCGACHRVQAGAHPDVTRAEVEGKNIKIGEIRELSSRLRLHSYEGGTKIGLVFEAERMTEAAQNAFLKTLEEPTPDTVLIMTTTNLNRLLPTIISRCQLLRLPPLPDRVIAELLVQERSLDAERASLVATLAGGNARRAMESELDFVIDFRVDLIRKVLAMEASNRIEIMDFAEGLARSSYADEEVFDLLAGFYRDVLHFKLGKEKTCNRDLASEVEIEAGNMNVKEILEKIEVIHNARVRAAGNANSRLNWEILTMCLVGVKGAEITAP